MSISDLLKSLYDNLVLAVTTCNEFTEALPDCYDAVEAKGGTLPQEQTAGNLPSAIESIPSGGGLSTTGYNYTSQGMQGIGQCIWAWDKGKEVTEIVDDYTDMNIDNSNGDYSLFYMNIIFPNLQKLTFTKSGTLLNTGQNRYFWRYIDVSYLSIPFTLIEGDSSGSRLFNNANNLTTLKFPNLVILKATASYTGILVNSITNLTTLELPVYEGGAGTTGYDGNILSNCNLIETISIPHLKRARVYTLSFISNCSNLKYINLPELEYIHSNNINTTQSMVVNCPAVVSVVLGKITHDREATNYGFFTVDMAYLEKFEVGQDTEEMPNLMHWTATNVADDTLLNTNIATYLANRLYDYSGGTAHTITISTALYNRLTQATKDIFTNKNWTIATA